MDEVQEVKVLQVEVPQHGYERMGMVVSIAEAGKVFCRRGQMQARTSMRVSNAVWADNAIWMDDKARELWVWLAAGEAVGQEITVEATDYKG